MKPISIDRVNGLAGTLFIAFGIFFAVQSLGLKMGTAFRMGPGYAPLIMAGMLIVLGLVIIAQATRVKGEPFGPIAWRGMALILPAPIFFGLTVRGLGFVLAVFFTSLIASFASARMRPAMALALSAGITVFSVAVFSYALGLPFQRLGPWLPF